ncbi:hypothetical protein HPB49_019045 [Dermacentor silvarum]|uniref:Uncharacterized protein n=1 Tax=Dermacentor silvarum TaxID=543639 RepID=A0ACB8D7F3_DERSI|nr:hypothetical protein HPB49_019045 [Dermacentor silvarum]
MLHASPNEDRRRKARKLPEPARRTQREEQSEQYVESCTVSLRVRRRNDLRNFWQPTTVASCMRGCSANPPQQLSPSKQDVCPNPDKPICNRCGVQNPQTDHDCQLQCKLCGLPHEMASKECEKRLKPRPPPLYVRERRRQVSSSEYGTNKPQQEQQKISWAEVIASSKSTTDPFPPLPTHERNSRYEETICSLRRQNADLRKRNEPFMKCLEEQERRQEERGRRAQAREQALKMKLQHLIDQLQKQQEPTTTPTPPREHAPPIEDLESGLEHKMNKARTEDKAELRNAFRAELAQAVDTIRKSVAATVQAAVQTLRQEITQMGNELSQRISILEKDKKQARKKPKCPIREAQMNETLGSQDGE